MNKNKIKIKYLIGAHKNLPGYPTLEDFYYVVNRWYFLDGGKTFIHDNRGLPNDGNVIFSNQNLEELLGKELSTILIPKLINDSIIKEYKSTKFTTYYEIINNDII